MQHGSHSFIHTAWNPLHQSGCILPCCMESTAFNWDPLHNDASNPLRSIKIHCTTLHGIHCIQSGFIKPHCMEYTGFNRDAFYHAAWNPLHSMTLHGIHCINRDAFYHAAWNPLHSLGIHLAMLHVMHCV